MGYKDDSNKRYKAYGEQLDGVLITDENGNVIARLDKDGIKDGDGNTLVDGSGSQTENHTSDTQSGNGTATDFTVAHGLNTTPSHVQVTAKSAAAAGDYHVEIAGSTNITIKYSSPPSSGTDNLSWDVHAKA